MTPKERRGKWIFLILASLIILARLTHIGYVLYDGLAEFGRQLSVLLSLGLILALALLWKGNVWLQWVVGMYCILPSVLGLCVIGSLAVASPAVVAEVTRDWNTYQIGASGLLGLFYFLAGLVFLFSPSLGAFFRYQREGLRSDSSHADQGPALST